MKPGKPWTPDEIIFLIKTYREGWREKKIAEALNRSTGSTSKKIDALNLRQLYGQERKEFCLQLKTLNPKKGSSQNQIRKIKIKVPPLHGVPILTGIPESTTGSTEFGFNWVTLEDVISWLISIDIKIKKSSFKSSDYICDGKYLTAGQILLRCNQHRLRLELPIMHVYGITETD